MPRCAQVHLASLAGFAVALYVDMSNNQEGMLDQPAGAGLKAFTAAFVIGQYTG